MSNAAEIYEQAEGDLADGRYEDALRKFFAVVQAAPAYAHARLRVADALLNLGESTRARDVYRGLSWYYIKGGQPLMGLVVCKMLLALDPDRYEDVLLILAELYSSESDRVADIDAESCGEPPKLDAPALSEAPLSELVIQAAKLAEDTDAITTVPKRLPMIPLFSHLDEASFIHVLGSLRLRRFADGDLVINEGEPGESFFMLADGEVRVSKSLGGKSTTLAHLHEGSVFGEMALVSRAPRTATVTARGEVALLALARSDLERLAGGTEAVTVALRKFTRSRFLANLAATSGMFRDIGRSERRELLTRFQSRSVHEGDILIEEGEEGRGLFLILRGNFEVSRQHEDTRLELAKLSSGDVFGEISLLRKAPTVASVTARTSGEVLYLQRSAFDEVLADHPGVRSTLTNMSTERLKANLQLGVEGLPPTDDSAVLL